MPDSDQTKGFKTDTSRQPRLTGTRARMNRISTTSSSSRRHVPTSSSFVSESLILAFLFTIVLLLVPSLFYHISKQVSNEKKTFNTTTASFDPTDDELSASVTDSDTLLRSFLALALSYVSNVSIIVLYFYRFIRTIAHPLLLIVSFLLSVFRPVFIFLHLLLQILVILPFRAFVAIVNFLYPIYVFIGVACLAGGLVGFCAMTVTRLLRSLFT